MKGKRDDLDSYPFPSVRMKVAFCMMGICVIGLAVMKPLGYEGFQRLVETMTLLGFVVPLLYLGNVAVFWMITSSYRYLIYGPWILAQALLVIGMSSTLVTPVNALTLILSLVVYGTVMWLVTRAEVNYLQKRERALSRIWASGGSTCASTGAQSIHGHLIGKVGESLTPLTPSGKVVVNGVKFNARSEMGYIDGKHSVKVIGADAFELIVLPYRDLEESEGDE